MRSCRYIILTTFSNIPFRDIIHVFTVIHHSPLIFNLLNYLNETLLNEGHSVELFVLLSIKRWLSE